MVLGFASALQILLGYRGRGDLCDKEADPYSLARVEVRFCFIFLFYTIVLKTQPNTLGRGAPFVSHYRSRNTA